MVIEQKGEWEMEENQYKKRCNRRKSKERSEEQKVVLVVG